VWISPRSDEDFFTSEGWVQQNFPLKLGHLHGAINFLSVVTEYGRIDKPDLWSKANPVHRNYTKYALFGRNI
jgi:hypothetical protein